MQVKDENNFTLLLDEIARFTPSEIIANSMMFECQEEMDKIREIAEFLKNYDGESVTLMEVCGTHTASIVENGIESMLSDKIRLITGPGCPVCVTVASYIDKLCELSMMPNTCVCSFGDMIRVKGSKMSLDDAKANGGRAIMVYSPLDLIEIAKKDKDKDKDDDDDFDDFDEFDDDEEDAEEFGDEEMGDGLLGEFDEEPNFDDIMDIEENFMKDGEMLQPIEVEETKTKKTKAKAAVGKK